MSEIDDIPADEEVVLTATLDRMFKAAGCDPTCHCCENALDIGDTFKLACVDVDDQMLCANCTTEDLREKWKEDERMAAIRHAENRLRMGRSPGSYGFSRPHKVIE